MNRGVIFAGLTITESEIKQILDDAMVLPPVKAGDIIHVCRLLPKYILIIDGAFEACASVWHKEILYALSLNIPVMGAASMGALRAAELYEQGMIGVGLIYDYYKLGLLIDDDEVAVSYAKDIDEIKPISDAMINIRETVKLAVCKNIISETFGQKIISDLKVSSYKIRNFDHYLQSNLQHDEAPVFLHWLGQDNFVDQKKKDAEQAIDTIKNHTVLFAEGNKCVIDTLPFYSLHADMNSASFPYQHDFLPIEELQVQATVNSRNDIKYLTALAKLICISAIFYEGADNEASLLNFLKEIIFKADQEILKAQHDQLEKFFYILFDSAEINQNWLKNSVFLWSFIVSKLKLRGIAVTVSDYEKLETSKQLRIKHKLLTTESMMTWLDVHNISSQEYDSLMSFLSLFHYSINCNNLMYLDKRARNINWLKMAFILSDIFF